MINQNTDQRLYGFFRAPPHSRPGRKSVQEKVRERREEAEAGKVRHVQQVASSLFFKHNRALIPPYQIIVDTNFVNFSIQNKLDLFKSMMDCLYAECTERALKRKLTGRHPVHHRLCHGRD